MRKIFIFSIFLFVAFTISPAVVNAQQKKDINSKTDSAFICYSESTSYYHKSATCTSISKCNNLQKVSLEDAVTKYHRTACKKCAQVQPVQSH